jgi:hypothetical protein
MKKESFQRRLTGLGQSAIRLIKQTWFLPQSIAEGVRQRRRQIGLDAVEAERLDRIRNPSDYLGK